MGRQFSGVPNWKKSYRPDPVPNWEGVGGVGRVPDWELDRAAEGRAARRTSEGEVDGEISKARPDLPLADAPRSHASTRRSGPARRTAPQRNRSARRGRDARDEGPGLRSGARAPILAAGETAHTLQRRTGASTNTLRATKKTISTADSGTPRDRK